MKLKSKQTGEIMEFDAVLVVKDVKGDEVAHLEYDSIQKFIDQWEDVPEEPKGYWFIDSLGEVHKHTKDSQMLDIEQTAIEDWHLDIGNHFGTKEEAEKVVEKLKAWKRLKDKGFRFVGWCDSVSDNNPDMALFKLNEDAWETDTCEDLDTCFGGEE